jgi:hypothetical protein
MRNSLHLSLFLSSYCLVEENEVGLEVNFIALVEGYNPDLNLHNISKENSVVFNTNAKSSC